MGDEKVVKRESKMALGHGVAAAGTATFGANLRGNFLDFAGAARHEPDFGAGA